MYIISLYHPRARRSWRFQFNSLSCKVLELYGSRVMGIVISPDVSSIWSGRIRFESWKWESKTSVSSVVTSTTSIYVNSYHGLCFRSIHQLNKLPSLPSDKSVENSCSRCHKLIFQSNSDFLSSDFQPINNHYVVCSRVGLVYFCSCLTHLIFNPWSWRCLMYDRCVQFRIRSTSSRTCLTNFLWPWHSHDISELTFTRKSLWWSSERQ